jgi:hypothetical protein
MPSYWWQCVRCEAPPRTFAEECNCRGIVQFLWDILLVSKWDQSLLVRRCASCGSQSLRITYDFPRTRTEKEIIRVLHILGLPPWEPGKTILRMMWETSPCLDMSTRWFDFKYVSRRSIWGLNKAAVFGRDDLQELVRLYREKTGDANFLRV